MEPLMVAWDERGGGAGVIHQQQQLQWGEVNVHSTSNKDNGGHASGAATLLHTILTSIALDIGGTMENPQHEYTVGGTMVQYSQCEKDLGVEIDKKLSFKSHTENKLKQRTWLQNG